MFSKYQKGCKIASKILFDNVEEANDSKLGPSGVGNFLWAGRQRACPRRQKFIIDEQPLSDLKDTKGNRMPG